MSPSGYVKLSSSSVVARASGAVARAARAARQQIKTACKFRLICGAIYTRSRAPRQPRLCATPVPPKIRAFENPTEDGMDFELTEEQRDVVEAIRKALAALQPRREEILKKVHKDKIFPQ